MQLFVVYYGLALVGLKLDAWVAVSIGFTLHASAYPRRNLARLDRGRAARPGRGRQGAQPRLVSRMKDVVLPQAIRISLPATIGFLVQLIKGTSLAAIIGFTELMRAGTIVSNQNFKPLLVFGLVGALYFAHLLAAVALWRLAGAPARHAPHDEAVNRHTNRTTRRTS